MKLLLDTHVILWALTDDRRLSREAREMISEKENLIYFSTASLWEIAIKNEKAPEKCPYHEKVIEDLCIRSGYLPLDIKAKHVAEIRWLTVKEGKELQNHDPFDRILLAQAKAEDMVLLSHDSNFLNYEEACIHMV